MIHWYNHNRTTNVSKFVIILIGLFLLVNINTARAVMVNISASADTYSYSNAATTNYGTVPLLKLTGIIFALGYLIVFLMVWIYWTGFQNYTYISIGEPNLFIKYIEWGIGIIAIMYLISAGKAEADKYKVVSYDPFV